MSVFFPEITTLFLNVMASIWMRQKFSKANVKVRKKLNPDKADFPVFGHCRKPSHTPSECKGWYIWKMASGPIFILCVWVLVCTYICVLHACLVLTEARREPGSPRTGSTESHKLSCTFWVFARATSVLTTEPPLPPPWGSCCFVCVVFPFLPYTSTSSWALPKPT